MTDLNDIEKFVNIIEKDPLLASRRKVPDLVDKLNTLELLAKNKKLTKRTQQLLRKELIRSSNGPRVFVMKIHVDTKAHMKQYLPSFFQSMSELARVAVWDVLFHEKLTGKDMSLWIPDQTGGLDSRPMVEMSIKIPQAMFLLASEAIIKTTLIRSVGAFVRLAIIRYLKILDLITDGKNG